MDKQMNELKKELENIRNGEKILQARKNLLESDISQREEELETARAIVMQNNTLLEAEQENNLEEQDWEAEEDRVIEEMIDMEMARKIK